MAKTILVFSAKGGVGKTLVAANLAVALSRSQEKKVCLIDLDLRVVGDMARMLGLKPGLSSVDFINAVKDKPAGSIKKDQFLSKSASLDIDFLPGVLKPQQASFLHPEGLEQVLDLLENDYDYKIIETGNSYSDVFASALNRSNLIILVVTPDLLSVYQAKWAIDMLNSLHFPLKMIKIVLNRSESTSSISWQEVQATLSLEILAKLPSEGKAVGMAINQGIPVVVDSPKAKFTLSMQKLAEMIVSRKDDLFIERYEVDKAKLKEIFADQGGEFWDREGLSEALNGYIPTELDAIGRFKQKIHARLLQELNIKRIDLEVFKETDKVKELREKAQGMINDLLVSEAGSFISSPEMRKIIAKEILDEVLGLGILEDLLADDSITDIMVNNKDQVYIERMGKLELTNKKFFSNDQVKTTIERIIAPIGRRIDESVPMVDARLPDGSRVNAIIPPLALTGPTLTIRKFRKERLKVPDLIKLDTLTQPMADFLMACVLIRKNLIVSGGTGSGKTTVLNVLSEFIPNAERIATIEDAAELKLHQEDWVRLESRSANIEGKGSVTIRDLFRNTLRMRPDRIIIGECRGVETMDMLQAMNTGHDGSMTTIHANSTQDVMVRLDSMILMAGVELPVKAIHEMTSSAIDLIVHAARLSDGTRKIIQITEIVGMKDDEHIDIRDIFVFRQTGVDVHGKVMGRFEATGNIPTFYEEIKIKGIPLSEETFKPYTPGGNNQ